MDKKIIKVVKRSSDLDHTSEMWVKCSYEERRQEIVNFITDNKGYEPSPNMMFIREVVFDVPDHATIYDLKHSLEQIKRDCGLDCFQISIDRANRKAHMLFDWYDRNAQECVYLYITLEYKLSVILLKATKSPIPMTSGSWLRYYIFDEYNDNPEVFDDFLDWAKHQDISKEQYEFLRFSFEFLKFMCQGLTK